MKVNFRNRNPAYKNISFEGIEKKFIRKLQNIPKLPCPCCGKPMVPIDLVKDNKAFYTFEPLAAIEYIINFYGKSLTEKQEIIVNFFHTIFKNIDCSNITIADVCQYFFPRIAKTVRQNEESIFSQLRLTAEKLNGESRQIFLKSIDTADKDSLSRPLASENIRSLRKTVENITKTELEANKEILSELMRLFYNFPGKYSSPNTFIYEMHQRKYTSAEIFNQLLIRSMATIEHIKPKNCGGTDNISNLIPECELCNMHHGSKSWRVFLEEYPEMITNIKQTFFNIYLLIKEGKLSEKYADYLKNISNTFRKETEGKIDLDIRKLFKTGHFKNQ